MTKKAVDVFNFEKPLDHEDALKLAKLHDEIEEDAGNLAPDEDFIKCCLEDAMKCIKDNDTNAERARYLIKRDDFYY